MNLRRKLDGVSYMVGKVASTPAAYLTLVLLARRNKASKVPVVAPGGPVVSLTSYGDRIAKVYLTIESIGRGTLVPSRLILWLNEEQWVKNPPPELRRLQDRGLEILLTPDYGPHKKYYPYVDSQGSFESPLATADDDTVYPSWWLARLAESYRERPDLVNCYRARVLAMNGHGIDRYDNWVFCRKGRTESVRHFAVGASGIIYPPALLQRLKNSGTAFVDKCLRADDIWLHIHALRNGFKVRQIDSVPHLFATLPDTQRGGLYRSNVHLNCNDEYIRNLYTAADIEMLRSEISSVARR
jgi:hypothetical protein